MANDIWPQDADGDVLKRMQASGFDFSRPVDIDFNVDFDNWPPAQKCVDLLRAQFRNLKVREPNDHRGYVQIVVNAILTYDLVMFMQSTVSEMAAPFGGVCESWGVYQSN